MNQSGLSPVVYGFCCSLALQPSTARTMACGLNQFIDCFKCDKPNQKPVSLLESTTVMYTGGTIRPIIEGSVAKVDAIGFHDGKVDAVGSLDYVKTMMDSLNTSYLTVNLSTETLIPGMIEPHVHIVPTAFFMGWNDFGPFDGQYMRAKYDADYLKKSIADEKSNLESSGDLEKGAWILATGVDPSLMPFTVVPNGLNKLITLEPDAVDDMEKDTPVYMIAASGHTAYVNTPALQLIYDGNPDIQETYPTFEKYREHVNQGGGLQELEEMLPALTVIPSFQLSVNIFENVNRFVETALSRGATLLYDAAASTDTISIIDKYLLLHHKKIRIGYAKLCDSPEDVPEYKPSTGEFINNYQGNVKVISDGSNQGLTGYQSEPYCCEPANNVGAFNFGSPQPEEVPPEFVRLIQTILDKGWPLMCHANGDKAIKFALDAYELVLKGESGISKRHRIEHCSLVDSYTLDRIRDLGISPSFLIGHVGYWGYVFKNAIFEEKANTLDVCQSAIQKEMRISFHSDCFVTPLGPLRMMEQAITRIMEKDPTQNVLNEKEKVTPEQALLIVTNNAAWQCHADEWVGSLQEGKMADYVILSEDPITRANPVGMRDIPVLETWVEGRCVYKCT